MLSQIQHIDVILFPSSTTESHGATKFEEFIPTIFLHPTNTMTLTLKPPRWHLSTFIWKYHSVCPLVGIGTPHPLSPQRVCPPPRTKGGDGGTVHTRLRVKGWRESQFGRQGRKLSTLSTLWSSLSKTLWAMAKTDAILCSLWWSYPLTVYLILTAARWRNC